MIEKMMPQGYELWTLVRERRENPRGWDYYPALVVGWAVDPDPGQSDNGHPFLIPVHSSGSLAATDESFGLFRTREEADTEARRLTSPESGSGRRDGPPLPPDVATYAGPGKNAIAALARQMRDLAPHGCSVAGAYHSMSARFGTDRTAVDRAWRALVERGRLQPVDPMAPTALRRWVDTP